MSTATLRRQLQRWRAPPALTALTGAVVPASAFALYALAYGSMSMPPGPDVGYYLLGVRHMAAGRWPWGSEPPLSFAVLWPFTATFGDRIGFAMLSALLAAATCALLGALAATSMTGIQAARAATGATAGATASGRGALARVPDQALGWPAPVAWTVPAAQLLALLYASAQYAEGLLKNSLANVLMVAAVLAWARRQPVLGAVALLLASLAHPGAIAPLLAAVLLYALAGATARAGVVATAGRLWGQAASHRRLLPLALAALAAVAVSGLATFVAWPTIARYATTYFGAAAGKAQPFATWHLDMIIVRYLPLWLILVIAAGRRDSSCRNHASQPALRLAWAWAFALVGLSVVGGMVGRRLEIQLFAPLSVLSACYLYRLRGRKLVMLCAVAFGTALLVVSLQLTPLLAPAEAEALRSLGRTLPPQAKLVAHQTNAAYYAEYFTGAPIVMPTLLPQRGLHPGPTYILTENPTRSGAPWSAPALEYLSAQGVLVWQSGRFLLFEGRDDPAFFAAWPQMPRRTALELLNLDRTLWPAEPEEAAATPATRVLGWLLFMPAGLLALAGFNESVAAALGLVVSYLGWRSLRRRLICQPTTPSPAPPRRVISGPGPAALPTPSERGPLGHTSGWPGRDSGDRGPASPEPLRDRTRRPAPAPSDRA